MREDLSAKNKDMIMSYFIGTDLIDPERDLFPYMKEVKSSGRRLILAPLIFDIHADKDTFLTEWAISSNSFGTSKLKPYVSYESFPINIANLEGVTSSPYEIYSQKVTVFDPLQQRSREALVRLYNNIKGYVPENIEGRTVIADVFEELMNLFSPDESDIAKYIESYLKKLADIVAKNKNTPFFSGNALKGIVPDLIQFMYDTVVHMESARALFSMGDAVSHESSKVVSVVRGSINQFVSSVTRVLLCATSNASDQKHVLEDAIFTMEQKERTLRIKLGIQSDVVMACDFVRDVFCGEVSMKNYLQQLDSKKRAWETSIDEKLKEVHDIVNTYKSRILTDGDYGIYTMRRSTDLRVWMGEMMEVLESGEF